MRRLLLLLWCGVLLAGCATAPPRGAALDTQHAWETRRQALAALQDWSLDGRIGITLGDQGWHATLDWRQHADSYEIQLLGPLGQGAGRLRGDDKGVVLRTAEGRELRAADAESLLYAQFGWWVPVSGLRYWLLGLPDPQQPAETTLDPAGRLSRLRQAGWEIAFTRYARVGAVELPDRLTLNNPKLRVKLVIDKWAVP